MLTARQSFEQKWNKNRVNVTSKTCNKGQTGKKHIM